MLLTFIIFFIVKNEFSSLAHIVITSFGFINFNTFPKSSKFKSNVSVFIASIFYETFFFHIKWYKWYICTVHFLGDNPFEVASKFTSLTKELKESIIISLTLAWKISLLNLGIEYIFKVLLIFCKTIFIYCLMIMIILYLVKKV